MGTTDLKKTLGNWAETMRLIGVIMAGVSAALSVGMAVFYIVWRAYSADILEAARDALGITQLTQIVTGEDGVIVGKPRLFLRLFAGQQDQNGMITALFYMRRTTSGAECR